MASDAQNVDCHKEEVDSDCPPPIPPRPIFTFAAHRRRNVNLLTPPADSTVPLHADSTSDPNSQPVDSTASVHAADSLTSSHVTVAGDEADSTSSEVKSHGLRTGEHPVLPPRHKSTTEIDNTADVSRLDELTMSPRAANDEVFLACNDDDDDDDDDSDAEKSRASEHEGLQTQNLSEKQLPQSSSSAVNTNDSDGLLTAPASVETTLDVCDRTMADDASQSTAPVYTGSSSVGPPRVGAGGYDPAVARTSDEPPTEAQLLDSHVGRYDPAAASEAQSVNSHAAPLLSFSEFEDFGLDPDLFRPDCLDADEPFSEKTAKFTRAASPLYEAVTLDEDETGEVA